LADPAPEPSEWPSLIQATEPELVTSMSVTEEICSTPTLGAPLNSETSSPLRRLRTTTETRLKSTPWKRVEYAVIGVSTSNASVPI
jgi:hypothetical protein